MDRALAYLYLVGVLLTPAIVTYTVAWLVGLQP